MRRVFICTVENEYDDEGLQFDDRLDVTEIDQEHILNGLPAVLDEYLTFDLSGDGATVVDMDAVFSMLDYLPDKPKTVLQLLMKLSAAVANMFHEVYDELNDAKEELDEYASRRTTYFANEDNGLKFKRTKDNIESFVKAEPTWKVLSAKVKDLSSRKARLYSTRDLVSKTVEIAQDFVKQAPNVRLDRDNTDKSFNDVMKQVIENTSQIKGAVQDD